MYHYYYIKELKEKNKQKMEENLNKIKLLSKQKIETNTSKEFHKEMKDEKMNVKKLLK